MDITKNFSLRELNTHNLTLRMDVITNLVMLVQMVLQPLRDGLGREITVTSGYRDQHLNELVGGVHNSQHLTGQAADIVFEPDADGTLPGESVMIILDAFDISFDQLVLYDGFTHVSYAVGNNRRAIIDKRQVG